VGLGAPFTFTTASGRKGMAGSLNSQANSGTATIVAAPGRDFAVEMILLAPRHEHNLNLIAGHRILLSLDMAVPPP
jgi:hypothetical protein